MFNFKQHLQDTYNTNRAIAIGISQATYTPTIYTHATPQELQAVAPTLCSSFVPTPIIKRLSTIPPQAVPFSIDMIATTDSTVNYYFQPLETAKPKGSFWHTKKIFNIKGIDTTHLIEVHATTNNAGLYLPKELDIDKLIQQEQRRVSIERTKGLHNSYSFRGIPIHQGLRKLMVCTNVTEMPTHYPKKSQEIGHTKDSIGSSWTTALTVKYLYNKQGTLYGYTWCSPSYEYASDTYTNLFLNSYMTKNSQEHKDLVFNQRKELRKNSIKELPQGRKSRARRAIPTPPSQKKEVKLYKGRPFKTSKAK